MNRLAAMSIGQLRATRGSRDKPLWNDDAPMRDRVEVLHFALNHAGWSRRVGNTTAALAFLAMAREARCTMLGTHA